MADKEDEPRTRTLADKVNDAIGSGTLERTHGRHYKRIAKELDSYESNVDGYTADLAKKIGTSHELHKRPDDLYMALIKHIAQLENIGNAGKIKTIDDLSDEDMDKVRNHLNINYGIPNETELRKVLDTAAGGSYKSEDEVKEALTQLAHRKGQHAISKAAQAWASDKEWAAHAGKSGTHYKFLQLVDDHHRPESARREIDTYKSPEEAIRYIGSIAQEAYRGKKEARRKV